MDLPKFLIADNDDFPENTYVVYTGNPSFIIDVDSEEYKILDETTVENEIMQDLIEQALGFYENELEKYEEEED